MEAKQGKPNDAQLPHYCAHRTSPCSTWLHYRAVYDTFPAQSKAVSAREPSLPNECAHLVF